MIFSSPMLPVERGVSWKNRVIFTRVNFKVTY